MHNIAVREPSKVNPERMKPQPVNIYNLIFIFFLTKAQIWWIIFSTWFGHNTFG